MQHIGTKHLETSRLLLRRFTMEDAEAMYRNWASDDAVTKFLTWPTHPSSKITAKVLADWTTKYDQLQYYQWAIVLKETGEPIGSIGAVDYNDKIAMVHIGYCIGSKWWKQGITSEAMARLLAFFFDEVGVNRVEAKFDPRNPNSGRVMQKVGMKYEGTMRQVGERIGERKDLVDLSFYGLVAEDYRKLKQNNDLDVEKISPQTQELTYTSINSLIIDQWVEEGREWGKPIDHATFVAAQQGDFEILLTPTKYVPKSWFGNLKRANVLGLASGGGQQMPIFAAKGANCTLLDYSYKQLQGDIEVAKREGYQIETIQADMSQPLPFGDESFDLIVHPVSNCYIEDVRSVWKECYRILKPGGILLAGLPNEINYVFDEAEEKLERKLPFNPLHDETLYQASIANHWGIQFSHNIEEQIGGQLEAGFTLVDLYQDTNGVGNLHEFGIPSYWATKAVKRQ